MESVALKEEIISMIKEKLGYMDTDEEDMQRFRRLDKKKSEDFLVFAKLVVLCYDGLENIISKLESDSEYAKQLYNYLFKLESATQINMLRTAMLEYNYGMNIGDSRIEEEIKFNVISNAKMYKEMIRIYFKLFDEAV